jgi:hypothetical protein
MVFWIHVYEYLWHLLHVGIAWIWGIVVICQAYFYICEIGLIKLNDELLGGRLSLKKTRRMLGQDDLLPQDEDDNQSIKTQNSTTEGVTDSTHPLTTEFDTLLETTDFVSDMDIDVAVDEFKQNQAVSIPVHVP